MKIMGRVIVFIILITLFPFIFVTVAFCPTQAFGVFVVLVVIWNLEYWAKYRRSFAEVGAIVCLFMVAVGVGWGSLAAADKDRSGRESVSKPLSKQRSQCARTERLMCLFTS